VVRFFLRQRKISPTDDIVAVTTNDSIKWLYSLVCSNPRGPVSAPIDYFEVAQLVEFLKHSRFAVLLATSVLATAETSVIAPASRFNSACFPLISKMAVENPYFRLAYCYRFK